MTAGTVETGGFVVIWMLQFSRRVTMTCADVDAWEEELSRRDRLDPPVFYMLATFTDERATGMPTTLPIRRCRRCGRYERPWAPEEGHDYADPSATPLYTACPDARRKE
jgi:hypothetical protein